MIHKQFALIASAAVLVLASFSCSTASKQGSPDTIPTGVQHSSTVQKAAGGAQFVSYENALNIARDNKKLIFVDIYTDWCTWCHKLEKDVYPDAAVQKAFASSFVLTKLNAESDTKHTYKGNIQSEREISANWNVTAFPTMIFLDETEKPIFAYEGYLPPAEFVKLLTFVSSGDYQKNNGDFRAWLGAHGG